MPCKQVSLSIGGPDGEIGESLFAGTFEKKQRISGLLSWTQMALIF